VRRSKTIPASLLLEAYCTGIFPMAMESGEIAWFSPDPRGIILLDAFHIPHGLKRVLKKDLFQIRLNTAFEEVSEPAENAEKLGSAKKSLRAT
jgi:leucyl/phenylalanyl-tRNA---protein transferase